MQKEDSADQEPRWGCNNSEIVAKIIVLMIRQPSEAFLIRSPLAKQDAVEVPTEIWRVFILQSAQC
jgi:hypothetical protein